MSDAEFLPAVGVTAVEVILEQQAAYNGTDVFTVLITPTIESVKPDLIARQIGDEHSRGNTFDFSAGENTIMTHLLLWLENTGEERYQRKRFLLDSISLVLCDKDIGPVIYVADSEES